MKNIIFILLNAISIITICGLILGYLGDISLPYSYIIVALSIIISVIITKEKYSYPKIILIISTIITMLLLIKYSTDFIYPNTCSDLMNHAYRTREISEQGKFFNKDGIIIPHDYPQIYYSYSSLIYNVIKNTYALNSINELLMYITLIFLLYNLGDKLYNKKIAERASILFSVSIINLFFLHLGFIPQLFSLVYLVYSLYLYINKKYNFLLLSTPPLLAFPFSLFIFIIYIILDRSFNSKYKFKELMYFGLAIILILPELINIIIYRFQKYKVLVYIRGGILLPPIPQIILYVLAIIEYLKLKDKRFFNYLLIGFFLMIISNIISVIQNLIFKYLDFTINSLYITIKMVYLFNPFSYILLSKYLNNKNNLFKIILFLSIIYFIGFLYLLPDQENFDPGVYYSFEFLHNLNGNFTISINPQLLDNKFKLNIIYSYKDYSKYYSSCPNLELIRLSSFSWLKDESRTTTSFLDRNNIIKDFPEGEYLIDYCHNENFIYKSYNICIYNNSKFIN